MDNEQNIPKKTESGNSTPAPHAGKKSFNSYKRSSVKQFSSVISILIMLPVFAIMMIFFVCFPRSEVSQIEKRNLALFPEFSFESYFNGSFTAGINQWFTDTAPFRDDLKNNGNGMKALFGISTQDSVNVVGDIKKVPKKTKKPSETGNVSQVSSQTSEVSKQPGESSKDESSAQESSESKTQKNYRELDAEYTVENGVIVVNQDGHYRGLELFGGGSGNAYVDALNDLRSTLDSKIRIYSMIIPLPCEYYTPANYDSYTANQKEYIDDLSSRLSDGITAVDVDTVLAGHTEENIYCRTDHHWMPLGAYYAAQEFAKAAGVDFKPLSTFTPQTIEGFVGTMYAFSGGDINIKNDPEDFTYYIPDNYSECKTDFYDTDFSYDYTGSYFKQVGDPQSNAYLTFFGGDEQIVKIRTNIKNGRKLILIKDSYGNAVPGYLMNSFEEIYIADMRYFQPNLVDFIDQMGITDVLFAMVTYSAFGNNSYNLPDLLTQAKGQTIVDNYDKGEE
ncbi:MAG: hypothetical protein IJU51_00175 [Clostridia bacterium]|nr:hypothetical protein [Clostridia bacterium]